MKDGEEMKERPDKKLETENNSKTSFRLFE